MSNELSPEHRLLFHAVAAVVIVVGTTLKLWIEDWIQRGGRSAQARGDNLDCLVVVALYFLVFGASVIAFVRA